MRRAPPLAVSVQQASATQREKLLTQRLGFSFALALAFALLFPRFPVISRRYRRVCVAPCTYTRYQSEL
jgi:hypothetical protein